MVKIRNIEDKTKLTDGNRILGDDITLDDSTIIFSGNNNTLYCEGHVVIKKSNIKFNGSNSIIFLSQNSWDYQLKVRIYNENVLYIGKDCYHVKPITMIISEGKNIFVGDNCMIALEAYFRNADAHLIYDSTSKKRINNPESIFIGDHVWVGQGTTILKGCQIESGVIIGAKSIISNKHISHNSVCVGSGKTIKKGVFWDRKCTHKYTQQKTANSYNYSNLNSNIYEWCYSYSQIEYISFDEIERIINDKKNEREAIIQYLSDLPKDKNRFVSDSNISRNKKDLLKEIIKQKGHRNKVM